MVEKLSATLFGMWNMGLSASVTPIAGSHCRIVVVVVFVVEIIYVVIFASLCLRHCHRWSVRPTDQRADHGSVCVVDLAGGTILYLNVKKSKNLYLGKPTEIHHKIMLHGKAIDWVSEWSYLGVKLKSAKQFDCSIKERIQKFYRCANAILRIDGRSNDMVMLRLLETHCVPILTYAIEIIHVSNRDERRQLRVAYNSLFRKLFMYKWNESVSALPTFLGRPTWEQLIESRRERFIKRVREGGHHSLSRQFVI